VEKKLGLQGRNHDATREELEAFNRLCRESVWSTIQDWNVFTERLGFWVDLDDAYITYQNPISSRCGTSSSGSGSGG
jgi:isoleucyl-tRNA synthetase